MIFKLKVMSLVHVSTKVLKKKLEKKKDYDQKLIMLHCHGRGIYFAAMGKSTKRGLGIKAFTDTPEG